MLQKRHFLNCLSRCWTILGIACLISAILLCRFDILYRETLLPKLPYWAISWITEKSHQVLSKSPFQYWRTSTPLGVVFLIIGIALIHLKYIPRALFNGFSARKPSIDPVDKDPSRDKFQLSHQNVTLAPPLLLLGLLPIISILAAYLLEQLKILNSLWVFVGWLALNFTSLLYLRRLDLKTYISLRIPLSKRELFLLLAGSVALVLFYQRGVDSWQYAFIGDEYGFLTFAISLLNKPFAEASPLEASGYADFFPMLLSWWQALFLYLFGEHNAAWRLSVAVITASCLIPFYILFKLLIQSNSPEVQPKGLPNYHSFPSTVLVAITTLFLSEFTVVWAKIGKPHAVFLPPAIFASSAAILGIRNRSHFYLFLAGVFAGLGTYLSSLSPILALAACGTLLITLELKISRTQFFGSLKTISIDLFIITSAFLIVAAPLLVQFDFWQNMFEVNLTSEEASRNSKMFWAKLISAVMMPLDFKTGIHFMSGNPVDVISALLILIGLTTAKFVGWRALGFAVLLHLEFSLLAGGLSKYHYPPESRMMVAMFPLALLAAFGFIGVCNLDRDTIITPPRPHLNKAFKMVLSIIISAWIAIYHWVKLEEYNPHSQHLNSSMAILKSIQQFDDPRRNYWLFASLSMNRQPFEFFSQFFNPNFALRSFSNDHVGLLQMRKLIADGLSDNRTQDLPSAIIIDGNDPLKEEVVASARAHDINILSFNPWGLSPRREDLTNPISNHLLPVIKTLENRGASIN